jgi:hypothetical protein
MASSAKSVSVAVVAVAAVATTASCSVDGGPPVGEGAFGGGDDDGGSDDNGEGGASAAAGSPAIVVGGNSGGAGDGGAGTAAPSGGGAADCDNPTLTAIVRDFRGCSLPQWQGSLITSCAVSTRLTPIRAQQPPCFLCPRQESRRS